MLASACALLGAFAPHPLARGDELKLAECSSCGALLVTERITLVAPRCVYCLDANQPA